MSRRCVVLFLVVLWGKAAGSTMPPGAIQEDVAVPLSRGKALLKKHQYADAVREFSEAIRLQPAQATAWVYRAKVYAKLGEFEKMLADYREGLRLAPRTHETLDELAWQLATCPDPLIRDGKQALELARKACQLSDNSNPWYFDTVAAAHAELGQFDEAVRAIRHALEDAELSEAQANSLRGRLAQYQKGQPTRALQTTPSGVDFALYVILPIDADVHLQGGDQMDFPADFTVTKLSKEAGAKAMLHGKATADEADDAMRTIKVTLRFPVMKRSEQFDLEYTLKRGQTRWVDARLIVDEWTRTLEVLDKALSR